MRRTDRQRDRDRKGSFVGGVDGTVGIVRWRMGRMDEKERWTEDGLKRDGAKGELRASFECVDKMPSFYLFTLHPPYPHSSSPFTHAHACLSSPRMRSSISRLHAARRNPSSTCDHKEARQARLCALFGSPLDASGFF